MHKHSSLSNQKFHFSKKICICSRKISKKKRYEFIKKKRKNCSTVYTSSLGRRSTILRLLIENIRSDIHRLLDSSVLINFHRVVHRQRPRPLASQVAIIGGDPWRAVDALREKYSARNSEKEFNNKTKRKRGKREREEKNKKGFNDPGGCCKDGIDPRVIVGWPAPWGKKYRPILCPECIEEVPVLSRCKRRDNPNRSHFLKTFSHPGAGG